MNYLFPHCIQSCLTRPTRLHRHMDSLYNPEMWSHPLRYFCRARRGVDPHQQQIEVRSPPPSMGNMQPPPCFSLNAVPCIIVWSEPQQEMWHRSDSGAPRSRGWARNCKTLHQTFFLRWVCPRIKRECAASDHMADCDDFLCTVAVSSLFILSGEPSGYIIPLPAVIQSW